MHIHMYILCIYIYILRFNRPIERGRHGRNAPEVANDEKRSQQPQSADERVHARQAVGFVQGGE